MVVTESSQHFLIIDTKLSVNYRLRSYDEALELLSDEDKVNKLPKIELMFYFSEKVCQVPKGF